MSDYTNTLAGLLKLNDQNMADIYPTNVLDDAPVIGALFAQPASQGGTLHKYQRRAAAAGSGFRLIGTGVSNAAEQFDEISVVCRYLDASFARDVALVDGYVKGRDAYMQRETLAALKAAFANAERALFQNIAGGFNGLLQFADYTIDSSAAATQIINMGGSNGASHSVWLLRSTEDGVSLIAGNDGNMTMTWDSENPTIIQKADANGNVYSALLNTIGGWFGLQVGSTYDAVRICGLDGTAGKSLDDDLIGKAIARFPANRRPNMIIMNRNAQEDLRASRTATNPTGAPAPIPESVFGIPVIVTDNLPNTEAQVNSTTTATTNTTQA
jgi:hypothetical protein